MNEDAHSYNISGHTMLTTADRAICTIDIHNVFKSVPRIKSSTCLGLASSGGSMQIPITWQQCTHMQCQNIFCVQMCWIIARPCKHITRQTSHICLVVFDDGQCRKQRVAYGICWWWAVQKATRGLWYSMMSSAGSNAWLVVFDDGQCRQQRVTCGIRWWAVQEAMRDLWYSMMGGAGSNVWLVVFDDGQCRKQCVASLYGGGQC